MKKYNIIILAGGENELWCGRYGYTKKAVLPIDGKPMLDWVVKAFHGSPYVDKIVVVGPKSLSCLDSMKYVHKHLYEGGGFIQNILKAVLYLKVVLYKCANTHNGYLISFCDAAYLTTDIINQTIENFDPHNAGLVMHYIHKDTIAKSGFPVENRTFLNIAGEKHTGSNIYYVRSLRKLINVLPGLAKIRKWRKEPHKILSYLGATGEGFPFIEKVISKIMKDKVKIFVSPFAEMGVDVDKPIDYELTKYDGPQKRKDFLNNKLEAWEEDWQKFQIEVNHEDDR